MDVVNYSEAARHAGVSRQMITKLKNLHINKESIKSYFIYDPESGKPGINIEDKSWVNYVNKVNKQRSNLKELLNTTKIQPNSYEQPNSVNKNKLINAVVDTLKEELNLRGQELKKIVGVIERKYEQ